jgi:hypothetical protein
MKIKKAFLSILVIACLFVPVSSQATPKKRFGTTTSLITGTLPTGGGFTGLVDITSFTVQNGALAAAGTLTGTLQDAAGNVIGTVTGVPVTIPVTSLTASCPILTLTLGPLHLNLLGLVVDLNQVVLNITAESGPGNLLGNLLCAVAGLLDGGGALQTLLQGIASLLNQLLAAL